MSWKTDKFTAARIRLFHATGMAKQKPLPFDRPRTSGSARMMAGELIWRSGSSRCTRPNVPSA